MHELPITKSICDMAVREGERLGAVRIHAISIKRGEYTDYVPEVIDQYFEMLADGTIAEGARLTFSTIPAVVSCRACGREEHISDFRLRCPICGSSDVELVSGKEFYIENMEIES